MKSKRWLAVPAIMLVCLCAGSLAAMGAGYVYLQDQPPGPLSDSGYYIRMTKVYYYPGFGISDLIVISGADIRSFKILDSTYALDASHVYREGHPIPQADPSTFEVLQYPYSRDASHVYLGTEIFSSDVANFEIVTGALVRDSQHIYWGGNVLSDDPANLEVIGSFDYYFYLKDSQTVFVNGNPIEDADPSTFHIIAAGYSGDASQVFYFDQPIPGANAQTFEIIDSPYARDALSVFWMGTAIPNADPETFRVLNADFECSADSAHAYYRDRVIAGVDASTLPPGAKANNCSETALFLAP